VDCFVLEYQGDKLRHIRDRLCANNCNILCLQETKRDNFDPSYLRNFCTPSFDDFIFFPLLERLGVPLSFGTVLFFLTL